MHSELIEDSLTLSACENDWQRTWLQDPQADIFASPFWFVNWWQHFSASNTDMLFHHESSNAAAIPANQIRCNLLTLRDGNDTVAVLPLVKIQSQWRRCPVTLLMPALNAHSPRSGFTLASNIEKERQQLLNAAAKQLRKYKNWDVLLLDGIGSHSDIHPSQQLQQATSQHITACEQWSHCYIPFDQDWDDYLRSQGRHFRQRLTQPARTITELGEVRYSCYQGEDAHQLGLPAFSEVDASSWKSVAGETIAEHKIAEYYQGMVKRFSQQNLCHIWVMTINEELAASFICLIHNQIVYLIKTSFKEKFSSARHAPSRVLLGHMIEHYWKAGWRGMDCVGRMAFVERWTNQQITFCPSSGYNHNHYATMLGWLSQMRGLMRRKPEHA